MKKIALIAATLVTGTFFAACAPTAPEVDSCPEYAHGDTVKVTRGPWKDSVGVVAGISRPGPSCNQGYRVFINNDPSFDLDLSGGIITLWEGDKK